MHSSWRDQVIDEAESWLGTPYHHRGFVKGTGCDCGTFLHAVFKDIIDLAPFRKSYAMDWATHTDEEMYLDGIEPYVTEKTGRPEKGDIIIWKYGKVFSHGTLYIGRGRFIHSWGMNGSMGVRIDVEKFFHLNIYQPDVKYRRPKKIFALKEELIN